VKIVLISFSVNNGIFFTLAELQMEYVFLPWFLNNFKVGGYGGNEVPVNCNQGSASHRLSNSLTVGNLT
jgi:hypothetical protein